jgi:hypothetical protein
MTIDSAARIDAVLRDLKTLGAAIADADFGYQVEAATFQSGTSASRLEAISAMVVEPLPDDYRYFLAQCAGFSGMDFHNGYVVHTPEEVVRVLGQGGAPKNVKTADVAIPVLPVASDGGGNVFLLQLRPPCAVLRWDHELGGEDAVSAGDPSLRAVADSFASFLERIRDDWRHFLGPDPASWTYIT